MTIKVGVIVGEWLRDRWIEDLLNYFIDQRTLVFIAIDVTEAPACQIHYSLAVRAYFNWEARRNAHLLSVSTKASWREWMVDAADTTLIQLGNYRPGQTLPDCHMVLDLTGGLGNQHAGSRLIWQLEPCPAQSLIARGVLFERIMTDQTVSSVKLRSISESATHLIDQRVIRLDVNSPSRSVADLGASAIGLVTENLVRWQRVGGESMPLLPVPDNENPRVTSISVPMMVNLFRRFRTVRRQRNDRLQWSVATIDTTLAADSSHWYEPSLHIDVVDPFPVWVNGRLHVFVELLDLNRGCGQIAVFSDVDQQGFVAPRVVLQQPFHLSFPVVFEHKGAWFMVPEQSESGRVSLYRNTRFPDEWVFERDLLPDFPGLDTVPLWHDDRWWLFTTARSGTNIDNNLHIFHANSLDAEFQPLAVNPVKSSLGSSRMAGHFFRQNGQLIRPAQNGCRTYGGGIVLNRVDQLTVNAYKETQVKTLDPFLPPYLEGLHTLNYAGDIALVDGVRRLPGQGSRWR